MKLISNQTHRDNLKILARFLYGFERDERHFDMRDYFSLNGIPRGNIEFAKKHINECGFSACAIGWALTIPELRNQVYERSSIPAASVHLFGVHQNVGYGMFLFSCCWIDFDNTPLGAAQRITYVLGLDEHDDVPAVGDMCYQHLTIDDLEGL